MVSTKSESQSPAPAPLSYKGSKLWLPDKALTQIYDENE
nr:MAG TPA: hypothetical protein [Caudoviricetes sp.]